MNKCPEQPTVSPDVAALVEAARAWVEAKAGLKLFEDENPNNTTLRWEKHLYRVHDAEAAMIAALARVKGVM